jgi:hypothetical protein
MVDTISRRKWNTDLHISIATTEGGKEGSTTMDLSRVHWPESSLDPDGSNS